jgi:hypothetical protein
MINAESHKSDHPAIRVAAQNRFPFAPVLTPSWVSTNLRAMKLPAPAALYSALFTVAGGRTRMVVTLVVGAAAALLGVALAVHGFRGRYRPVRLTVASLGLLGNAGAGVLTLALAVSYRW